MPVYWHCGHVFGLLFIFSGHQYFLTKGGRAYFDTPSFIMLMQSIHVVNKLVDLTSVNLCGFTDFRVLPDSMEKDNYAPQKLNHTARNNRMQDERQNQAVLPDEQKYL